MEAYEDPFLSAGRAASDLCCGCCCCWYRQKQQPADWSISRNVLWRIQNSRVPPFAVPGRILVDWYVELLETCV